MPESQSRQLSRDAVRVFAALSDHNRFRIVELLSEDSGALPCGVIGAALGLSPSLISHHLSVLESAGIVDRRKAGLCTMNRLRGEVLSRHLATLEQLLGSSPRA